MPFCFNCGTELKEDAKYCFECGTKVFDNNKNRQIDRETVFEGKIHKCPNCGEILKSFTFVCPLCGHEIRDTFSTYSIMELSRKLEEIEAIQMPQFQSKRSIMKTLVGKDFNNKIEEESRQEFDEQKEHQKANLILNFPVPNTREDILELMILSSSNINIKKGIDDDVTKAWIQKMEQVFEKAKITMGNSTEFTQIKSIYDRKKTELKNRKFKGLFIASYFLGGYCLIFSFLFFIEGDSNVYGIIGVIIGICILLLGMKFTSIYYKNKSKR